MKKQLSGVVVTVSDPDNGGLLGHAVGDWESGDDPERGGFYRLACPKDHGDLLPRLYDIEMIRTPYVGPTMRGISYTEDGREYPVEWFIQIN